MERSGADVSDGQAVPIVTTEIGEKIFPGQSAPIDKRGHRAGGRSGANLSNTPARDMAGGVCPAVACMKKVSQRKAPGAMSAMAFIVNPVKPNVACI